MSTMTTGRPDVEAYLAAVRAQLADLRPEERDELLLDVEASIVDAAEESDAPIAARLGSPADFATELRAAAGLTAGDPAPTSVRLRELWNSAHVVTARKTLAELAPIWWVARAYAAVWILAWIVVPDQTSSVPAVIRLGSTEFVLALLVLAAAASVTLGLRQRGRRAAGMLVLVVNLLLAGAALPAYSGLLDWLTSPHYAMSYVVEPTPGLTWNGSPVENIYAYSRHGRLLPDVLLFDHYGSPLELRPSDKDPSRRILRTKEGGRIFNSFPIRYYEPGTRRVAKPYRAPRIEWSPIVTPRLEPGRAKSP